MVHVGTKNLGKYSHVFMKEKIRLRSQVQDQEGSQKCCLFQIQGQLDRCKLCSQCIDETMVVMDPSLGPSESQPLGQVSSAQTCAFSRIFACKKPNLCKIYEEVLFISSIYIPPFKKQDITKQHSLHHSAATN